MPQPLSRSLYNKLWDITFIPRVGFLILKRCYNEAEAICRKGIQVSPRDSVYHQWLAKVLWKQRRLDEAITEYRLSIGLQHSALSADRIDLVNLLLEAKRYEEVIIESQKLIDPQFHKLSLLTRDLHVYTAFRSMAQAYAAVGDYQHAKEAWVKLLPYHKGSSRTQILRYIAQCEEYLRRSSQ